MYQRTPLSFQVKKVLKLLMVTLFFMVVGVSGFFFIKMTDTAEKGYSLKENQVKQQELTSERRILEQKVLEAQSMSELKEDSAVKSMVAPDRLIFAPPKSPLSKAKSENNKL